MKPRIKNESGFSLIEMMVVMAIIGLMAAIAVPSFNALMQKGRLKAAGREITMELILARAHSISTGLSQTITFDPANGTWTIPGKGTGSFASKGYHGIAFEDSSGDPIQFKTSAGADVDSITFKPDGTLENNLSSLTNSVGKIYLVDTKNNVDKITIEVSQYTGMVRLVDGRSTP
ncbi:MAG: prepilin-type N-terminal cleavage/methylation domain-containing protein [Proteobacteria bacterium]|nr:prepilin-type N-terminal cleavage/methylation domain-containing protein [Pseudomonadota bacterium]